MNEKSMCQSNTGGQEGEIVYNIVFTLKDVNLYEGLITILETLEQLSDKIDRLMKIIP